MLINDSLETSLKIVFCAQSLTCLPSSTYGPFCPLYININDKNKLILANFAKLIINHLHVYKDKQAHIAHFSSNKLLAKD